MTRSFSRLTTGSVVLTLLLTLSIGTALRPVGHTTAAPLAADPRTLLIARDISDAKSMDPGRFYEFTAEDMARNVYEMLVSIHGTDVAHPRPELATSWKITGGGKIFTFNLRHDVRFSTGNPVTANDVAFSYRRLGYLNDNPAFLMGASGKPVTINGVEAVGKYTVRFTLPTPDVSFLSALTTPNFGVLDSKVLKANGGDDSPDAATKDKATDYLNSHSLGTGPFVLTNWTRGGAGQIVLKPNKYYHGKKPSLTQIIYKGVTNATTQRLEVSRGTVDVATNIDIDGAKALRKDKNVTVLTGNTLDLIYMGMTTSADVSKPLSDKRVRQAVRYAIDYNGIVHSLLSNVGTQPNSMIPVGLLGNDTATNNKLKPKHDVAKAKALLKAAGYPDGFSIKLSYSGGVTFDGISFDLLAPKIAHDLAAIGINAQLDPQQASVLLAAYRAQKIAMILFNWGVDYPDSNDFAGPFSPGGGPAKRMWYTWDANMTKLVTQADSTSNSAKRASLYRQIQRIWLDEGPWVGVVQPRNIMVLHKGVAGYVYSPEYKNDFRTVHKS